MNINWRNLLIIAVLVMPIGFIVGHYIVDDTTFWWVMAIAIGTLLGLLGFKIREKNDGA